MIMFRVGGFAASRCRGRHAAQANYKCAQGCCSALTRAIVSSRASSPFSSGGACHMAAAQGVSLREQATDPSRRRTVCTHGAVNHFEHRFGCKNLLNNLETRRRELGPTRETGHFVAERNAQLLSEESEKEMFDHDSANAAHGV
ncbi:hypothetical protein MRX96_009943 [Rhipicephalus microplus]